MNIEILTQNQEKEWDDFVLSHPHGTIFQSSQWAHFKKHYWILAIKDTNKIIGGTLLLRQSLPKGYSWLYAPRGPLIDLRDQSQIDILTKKIAEIAKKEKAIFLRIDPPLKDTPALKSFKQNRPGHQPDHTLILNIDQDENSLLEQMKSKGRYNIRLATKKGVTVKKATNADEFFTLIQETTSRDHFSGHQKKFYQDMLDTLGSKHSTLFIAEYEKTPIAGLLATFHKDSAIYYYGASSNQHRNVMAPYLLQWEAIKEAKSRNCTHYDFLGIAPENAPNHPWSGVTSFKLKFGGTRTTYTPAQEKPFKPFLYTLYRIYKYFKAR